MTGRNRVIASPKTDFRRQQNGITRVDVRPPLPVLVDCFWFGLRIACLTMVAMLGGCNHLGIHGAKKQIVFGRLVKAADSHEWLSYGHGYSNQRFSPLHGIDITNVSQIVPIYAFQTGIIGPFEASPLVSQSVMFVSTAYDGVFALNAKTGQVLWERPPIRGKFRLCCGAVNRGVALSDKLVIIAQVDGVLVALDRQTGKVVWATTVADNAAGYSMTMAPLIYRNTVIVGVAGSEFGIRGFLAAYDLREGHLRWRWHATDPQHWFGPSIRLRSDDGQRLGVRASALARKRFADSWLHGGGGIWTTPAVDVARNTLYVTTGNPYPDGARHTRPGDNLYTDCIVALDASSGSLKWYYQEMPHDVGDLDAASPPILFDVRDNNGRIVDAVAEIGKNGVLYVLNRQTGELIRRSRNVSQVGASVHAKKSIGGSEWSPASYDPVLSYAVVSAAQRSEDQRYGHEDSERLGRSSARSARASGVSAGYATVTAIDPNTGVAAWQDRFDEGLVGGTLSTAGGLTFVGEGGGYFDALSTRTGELLWRFQTGAGVNAPPIAFEINGKEFIAVASGGNRQFGTALGDAIFVFGLPN